MFGVQLNKHVTCDCSNDSCIHANRTPSSAHVILFWDPNKVDNRRASTTMTWHWICFIGLIIQVVNQWVESHTTNILNQGRSNRKPRCRIRLSASFLLSIRSFIETVKYSMKSPHWTIDSVKCKATTSLFTSELAFCLSCQKATTGDDP